MLLVLFLSSRVKLSHTGYTTRFSAIHIREFAGRINRGYLPRGFAVGICRSYLPWVFCVCKRILFCICEEILFIWKQTFFICEQNIFICEIFVFDNVSFCYCLGSYGPPYQPRFDLPLLLKVNVSVLILNTTQGNV